MSGSQPGHVAETRNEQGRRLMYVASGAEGVSACLSPGEGATISSIKVVDAPGVHELFYRGNDWRPVEGWAGHAPWLWPVAGRSYSRRLADGTPDPQSLFHWVDQGRELPMPHHGFIRARSWETGVARATPDKAEVTASYAASAQDLEIYPFKYKLESCVSVSGTDVVFRFRVTADQTNTRPMPFTIGQHLTFDLASWWGGRWLEGTLNGVGGMAWGVDELSLARDELRLPGEELRLCDDSLSDVLIPAMPGQSVTLVSPDGRKRIGIEFDVTSLPSSDAALWVVHRDPGGRFFCLEPWVGWPNGLCSVRGRVMLKPGEIWSMSVRLRIMAASRGSITDTTDASGQVHVRPGVIDSLKPRARGVLPEVEPLSEDT